MPLWYRALIHPSRQHWGGGVYLPWGAMLTDHLTLLNLDAPYTQRD